MSLVNVLENYQVAEEYRTLRTNINFSLIDSSYKIIGITSCNQAEGKSTLTSNLAISIAQNGKNVLLIDCDLRKPTIHKKLKLSNKYGLTDILLGRATIGEAIQNAGIKNLSIITAGTLPPNPPEIIGSNRMKKFLEKSKEKFDIVLIDTTPLFVVSDAQILSSIIDGVLLIGCYRKTQKSLMLKAKVDVAKAGGKILGVIINKIPMSEKAYYKNYYYGSTEVEHSV